MLSASEASLFCAQGRLREASRHCLPKIP